MSESKPDPAKPPRHLEEASDYCQSRSAAMLHILSARPEAATALAEHLASDATIEAEGIEVCQFDCRQSAETIDLRILNHEHERGRAGWSMWSALWLPIAVVPLSKGVELLLQDYPIAQWVLLGIQILSVVAAWLITRHARQKYREIDREAFSQEPRDYFVARMKELHQEHRIYLIRNPQLISGQTLSAIETLCQERQYRGENAFRLIFCFAWQRQFLNEPWSTQAFAFNPKRIRIESQVDPDGGADLVDLHLAEMAVIALFYARVRIDEFGLLTFDTGGPQVNEQHVPAAEIEGEVIRDEVASWRSSLRPTRFELHRLVERGVLVDSHGHGGGVFYRCRLSVRTIRELLRETPQLRGLVKELTAGSERRSRTEWTKRAMFQELHRRRPTEKFARMCRRLYRESVRDVRYGLPPVFHTIPPIEARAAIDASMAVLLYRHTPGAEDEALARLERLGGHEIRYCVQGLDMLYAARSRVEVSGVPALIHTELVEGIEQLLGRIDAERGDRGDRTAAALISTRAVSVRGRSGLVRNFSTLFRSIAETAPGILISVLQDIRRENEDLQSYLGILSYLLIFLEHAPQEAHLETAASVARTYLAQEGPQFADASFSERLAIIAYDTLYRIGCIRRDQQSITAEQQESQHAGYQAALAAVRPDLAEAVGVIYHAEGEPAALEIPRLGHQLAENAQIRGGAKAALPDAAIFFSHTEAPALTYLYVRCVEGGRRDPRQGIPYVWYCIRRVDGRGSTTDPAAPGARPPEGLGRLSRELMLDAKALGAGEVGVWVDGEPTTLDELLRRHAWNTVLGGTGAPSGPVITRLFRDRPRLDLPQGEEQTEFTEKNGEGPGLRTAAFGATRLQTFLAFAESLDEDLEALP